MLITTRQFADRAGCTVRNIEHAIAAGRLAARQYGRDWMIDESQLESPLWTSRRTGPPDPATKAMMRARQRGRAQARAARETAQTAGEGIGAAEPAPATVPSESQQP